MNLASLIASHPAATLMVVGALVSTFYQRLDKYPKLHAFFGCLAHAGVNLPGVADALTKLVTSAAAKTLAVIAFTVAATGGAIMLFLNIQACTPAKAVANVATASQVAQDAYMLAGQVCIDLATADAGPVAKDCAKGVLKAGGYLDTALADESQGKAYLCDLAPFEATLATVPQLAPTVKVLSTITAACNVADAGSE